MVTALKLQDVVLAYLFHYRFQLRNEEVRHLLAIRYLENWKRASLFEM